MKRLLFCLPICLLFAPSYPWPPLTSAHTTQLVEVDPAANKIPGLPDPKVDSIAFLEFCLKHYDKTVKDYSLIFHKQECIDGKLKELEIVEVHYRATPYSVFMRWQQGARMTDCSLYVEGENKDSTGKSQVLPRSTALKVVLRPEDPEGYWAKKTSRYPINTFGLRQTLQRVLEPWKAAKAEGTLHVKFDDKLHKVPEAGNRTCYKFHRTQFARPEGQDGVLDVIIYIDCETLLLVGSMVKGKDGQILGDYFFRDINLQPAFAQGQFERSAVEK